MKVILTQDVENLGHTGQVVNVAPGFGRNYLLPQKKAVAASSRNIAQVNHQKAIFEHKLKKEMEEATKLARTMDGVSVTITRKVGESDKLFGSVTNQDVVEALAAKGVTVERKNLHLNEAIKALGTYNATVKVRAGLDAKITVNVVAE